MEQIDVAFGAGDDSLTVDLGDLEKKSTSRSMSMPAMARNTIDISADQIEKGADRREHHGRRRRRRGLGRSGRRRKNADVTLEVDAGEGIATPSMSWPMTSRRARMSSSTSCPAMRTMRSRSISAQSKQADVEATIDAGDGVNTIEIVAEEIAKGVDLALDIVAGAGDTLTVDVSEIAKNADVGAEVDLGDGDNVVTISVDEVAKNADFDLGIVTGIGLDDITVDLGEIAEAWRWPSISRRATATTPWRSWPPRWASASTPISRSIPAR